MSAFNNESCAVSSMINNKLLKVYFLSQTTMVSTSTHDELSKVKPEGASDSIVSLQVADATVEARQDKRSLVRVISRYHHPNVRAFTGLELD